MSLLFHSFAALAAHTSKVLLTMDAATRGGLDLALTRLLSETQKTFGTYQDGYGPFESWAPLAEATKADRVYRGFTEDDPLLRSGELRDSYYKKVEGNEGGVGSDLDKALGQEIGDPIKRVPPRSTLGLTFARFEKKLFEDAGMPLEVLLVRGAWKGKLSDV